LFLILFEIIRLIFFIAPGPGAARSAHSGIDAEFRQYDELQKQPDDDETANP